MLAEARAGPWTDVIARSLNGTDAPAVVGAAGGERVRIDGGQVLSLPPSNGQAIVPVSAHGLLALDWNHDFQIDLLVAGQRGLQLLLQGESATFTDATARAAAGGPPVADAFGAWAADVEMDGDLDIVIGASSGQAVVLRNNGDGTWRPLQPFAGVSGPRDFAWGDLDRDGDPDAALVDAAGQLHVFENRQAGVFRRIEKGPGRTGVLAVAVGDLSGDSVLDLITLGSNGAVHRASHQSGWAAEEVAAWPEWSGAPAPGSYQIHLADLDNNGALDVAASGAGRSRLWLADEGNELQALNPSPELTIHDIADLDDDGQLDLIGLAESRPVRMLGRGTMGYHWQVIRPRAQPVAGDQRINTFGVGGDIEVRSGLLVQKQTIAASPVHFGLGARTSIDVVRIVWPNGVLQAEFDRTADGVILADQRLKGSCPWVFADDGSGMQFVTDFLWRSPLGLRINAQDTAGVSQTEDWVRIRGDQLVARDGAYDVRITAELWETHFFDHVSLMVVDHPADQDVFVDERFSNQAPALAVHALTPPRPVARAWDDQGTDVTDVVSRRDGRHLATFARGPYQGIARDHYVEFEPGAPIGRGRAEWLVAQGWIYPTDSSINMAIGQGDHPAPRGLSLEAQDAAGRWRVVAPDLGFPAGKNKTVLIDLRQAADAKRLRLRTNLEVYWDAIGTAEAVDQAPTTRRIQPARADLRYRGFSRTSHERSDQPEVPDYQTIENVSQRWRDLVGYYTRFGDVSELLDRVDDRYVIMNAGDEMRLSFPAPPPPPAGWTRDFVLIGDGWEKDGDYNTGHSQTVLPLPSHDRPDYGAGVEAAALEHDPVYRRHAGDWQTYHTRFVTPREFLQGLGPAR